MDTPAKDDRILQDTVGGSGPLGLEDLLAQAGELAASVAKTLSQDDQAAAPAAEPPAQNSGGAEGPPGAAPPPTGDVESLLTNVEQLGKDLASQLSALPATEPPLSDDGPELVEGIPIDEENVETVATVMPDPELTKALADRIPALPSAPPPAEAEPVSANFAPDAEQIEGLADPGAAPVEEPVRLQPLPADEDDEPADSAPGGLKLLWWMILQSAPVRLCDQLLTLLDRPFVGLSRSVKDALGYGGILLALLGSGGLAMALLGR